MSRFVLIAAVYGAPPGGYQPQKWPPGTVIVDATPQFMGDIVWPGMCAFPNPTVLRPLDAAAVTAFAAAGFPNIVIGTPSMPATGADSVRA
jgi:hypothetical protein